MIHFEPITTEFHDTAIKRGWLDDEATNKQMGFGSGPQGRLKAREWMRDSDESKDILAVYLKDIPVGWIAIHEDDGNTVWFTLYLDSYARKKISRSVVWTLVDKYVANGYNRVETRALTINRPYWNFYRRYCGFYEEGKLRNKIVMDGGTYDCLVLSMVPRQWKNFKEKWYDPRLRNEFLGRKYKRAA